jgi:hypothetical protein
MPTKDKEDQEDYNLKLAWEIKFLRPLSQPIEKKKKSWV